MPIPDKEVNRTILLTARHQVTGVLFHFSKRMLFQKMHGTLRAAECRFFIVEKSVVMVYNKLLNFAGVTKRSHSAEFEGGNRYESQICKKIPLHWVYCFCGAVCFIYDFTASCFMLYLPCRRCYYSLRLAHVWQMS